MENLEFTNSIGVQVKQIDSICVIYIRVNVKRRKAGMGHSPMTFRFAGVDTNCFDLNLSETKPKDGYTCCIQINPKTMQ
jgi:hypothetical protein